MPLCSCQYDPAVLVAGKRLELAYLAITDAQRQYIFIPVVPPSLLNYCTAPMPFVVGIHASHLNEVKRMPVDEIMYVDLDNGVLRTTSTLCQDIQVIPPRWHEQLQTELDDALLPFHRFNSAPNSEAMASAFRSFFYQTLYGYSSHFQVQADGAIKFNEEDFLAAQTREARPLCQQFVSSQLFHTYAHSVAQRMSSGAAQHQFEYDLYQYALAHPRGLVEQLSTGFASVLSKYMVKKDLYTRKVDGPVLQTPSAAQNSQPTIADTGRQAAAFVSAMGSGLTKKLQAVPSMVASVSQAPPPLHPLNETWNKSPETVQFGVLHQLFSPSCDRQQHGILYHQAQVLPLINFSSLDEYVPLVEPLPGTVLAGVPSPVRTPTRSNSLLDSPNPMTGSSSLPQALELASGPRPQSAPSPYSSSSLDSLRYLSSPLEPTKQTPSALVFPSAPTGLPQVKNWDLSELKPSSTPYSGPMATPLHPGTPAFIGHTGPSPPSPLISRTPQQQLPRSSAAFDPFSTPLSAFQLPSVPIVAHSPGPSPALPPRTHLGEGHLLS